MNLLYAEYEIGMSETVVDISEYRNHIVDAVYNGGFAFEYARTEQL